MKPVSEWLNQTTKTKRSQAHRDRCSYAAQHDQATANRVWWCGSYIRFREWIEGGDQRVLSANLCKKAFLCPICAARRAGKQHAAYEPKFRKLLAEDETLKPVMVTFTIRSGPDLLTQFNHLQGSLRKAAAWVRRGRSKSGRNDAPAELSKILGQVRSIEIKRSKSDPGNWHVHCHAIALVREWIDIPEIRGEWLRITGDSYIVDARAIRPKDEESDDLHSALCEVLKYPLKFMELHDGDAWHCHETLAGRRMTDSLGLLRGVRIGSLDEDEIDETCVGPYRDYVAMWLPGRDRYRVAVQEDVRLPVRPLRASKA